MSHHMLGIFEFKHVAIPDTRTHVRGGARGAVTPLRFGDLIVVSTEVGKKSS